MQSEKMVLIIDHIKFEFFLNILTKVFAGLLQDVLSFNLIKLSKNKLNFLVLKEKQVVTDLQL